MIPKKILHVQTTPLDSSNSHRLKSEYLQNKFLLDRLRYEQDSVSFSDGKIIHIIKLSSISYIQSSSNYSTIHLINGKKHLTSKTLKNWAEKINHPFFVKPHRSYIINKLCASGIDLSQNTVYLGEQKIPIARSLKSEIVALFRN